MSDLINTLLGTGFRAAISPMTLAACIAMLDTDRPRRNSLSFVAGYTFLHVVLGILAFIIGGLAGSTKLPPTIEGIIKLVLGALLISFGVVAWFKARGPEDPPPRWAQALEEVNPFRAFIVGLVAWINNLTTLVFYIAGLQALVSANLGLLGDILLLALFILLVEIELIVPIIGYVIKPEWSHNVLEDVRKWMMKHNRALEVAVFGVFGVWLLAQGAFILLG